VTDTTIVQNHPPPQDGPPVPNPPSLTQNEREVVLLAVAELASGVAHLAFHAGAAHKQRAREATHPLFRNDLFTEAGEIADVEQKARAVERQMRRFLEGTVYGR